MIRAFIESLLGEMGRALAGFYEQNSLLINGIILLYALSVYLAHLGFQAVYMQIVSELKIEKEMGKEKLTALLQRTELDWQKLQKVHWFPFIALSGKIIIHYKSKATLQKIFTTSNLLALVGAMHEETVNKKK